MSLRFFALASLAFALLGSALTSCSTSRIVKPLEAKQWAAGFDLGGPIIDFAGAKIPIPLTSFTGAYGINNRITATTSLHTTALAAGVFQCELGAVGDIIPASGRRPGLSGTLMTHWMAREEFRFYPELALNMHWAYSEKRPHFAYLSWSNIFDFWQVRAHNEANPTFYLPHISLGHSFVTKKMRYNIEARWLAPFTSNQNIVVGYNGIANQGALGVYFSVYRVF